MYQVSALFTELIETLEKLRSRAANSPKRLITPTDTSEAESMRCPGRPNVLRKKTFKMKKANAADQLGRLFMTGPPILLGSLLNSHADFTARICLC